MKCKCDIDYYPNPINVRSINLPDCYHDLIEKMAINMHEEWADLKMKDGWTYGALRYDQRAKQSLENKLSNFADKIDKECGKAEWTYGSLEIERRKKHPSLVPFDLLTEDEKNYNRILSENILKLIYSFGYTLTKLDL